jgi:uncharacterized protein YecE (DUF72 family)
MIEWKIGCSGYHYAEWKRIFYPEDLVQRKWFEFYAQHFKTLELNVTFYRFPRHNVLQSWYDRSPENFSFAIKAPRLITHYKRLNDAQRALRDFYAIAKAGLKEKLGCVLFQFPSSFVYEEHRLERIVSLLDQTTNNVVEFRHASWWQDVVFKSFAERNITFCGMSHPDLPDQVIRTTRSIYYRFHGVPHLYSSQYETEKLEQVMNEIYNLQSVQGVDEAFVLFNNTAEGAALVNAKQFQELNESVQRIHH